MKKLIFILALLMVLSSCNKYIATNVYERTYNSEQSAIVDVYNELKYYKVDSLPLNQWITNEMSFDTTKIEQYSIRKIVDKKTEYTFVYTKYTYPLDTNYQFVIRYKGKKNDDIFFSCDKC